MSRKNAPPINQPMRLISTLRPVLLVLVLALISMPISAQDDVNDDAEAEHAPADPFNRGTPRRSADGFIAAADAGDFDRAAEYLDLRNLRGCLLYKSPSPRDKF